MRYYHPIFMVKVKLISDMWCPALKNVYKHSTLQGYEYSDFIIPSSKEGQEIFKSYLMSKDPDVKAVKLVELNYLDPCCESVVIDYRELRGDD